MHNPNSTHFAFPASLSRQLAILDSPSLTDMRNSACSYRCGTQAYKRESVPPESVINSSKSAVKACSIALQMSLLQQFTCVISHCYISQLYQCNLAQASCHQCGFPFPPDLPAPHLSFPENAKAALACLVSPQHQRVHHCFSALSFAAHLVWKRLLVDGSEQPQEPV